MNMFKPTSAKTPEEYINLAVEPRKSEIKTLDELIRKTVPNLKPFIISGMIGYGKYRYKSASGKEGDWCTVALASQKNYISVYICAMYGDKYIPETYRDKFPKANIGKSCIRFKKNADIDLNILKELLKAANKAPKMGEIK